MIKRVKNLLDHDDDIAIWFQLLCENGPQAIEAQAWQVASVLKANRDEVRDAMLELAHELLPDSPAGEDPRQAVFRELRIWASRQPQDVQDRLTLEGFQAAWDSGLSDFRNYLRSRCQEAVRVAA